MNLVRLQVQLLGRFRVTVDDRVVADDAWRRRKAAALVKLLALAPEQRAHREQLLDWLWPHLEVDAGLNNLHGTLHVARRVLHTAPNRTAGGLLQWGGDLLHLHADGSADVDVQAFLTSGQAALRRGDAAACEAALAWYGGELLPEDRYEEWAAGPREGCRTLALSLWRALAGHAERQADPLATERAWRAALALEPALEEAHLALMRLHAGRGEQVAALRQFQALREALRDLGLPPGKQAQALYASLLPGEEVAWPSAEPADGPALIGRRDERRELVRLLDSARLVTLVGTGGIGKTTLARALAGPWREQVPGEVAFVELAAVPDGALLVGAVAQAVSPDANRSLTPLEGVVEALSARPSLLILDNCEHLLAECAGLVATLLRRCPPLRILATGRLALGLPEEVAYRVPPLAVPPPDGPLSPDALRRIDTVALFLRRARAANPTFSLAAHNVDAVARVCRALDGLPLAVELVAARVGVLTPAQLEGRLTDLLSASGQVPGVVPARHSTLGAALRWSIEALTGAQRRLLSQLSVFPGSFGVDALTTVCAPAPGVGLLDDLGSLARASLVEVEERTGEARYRLLGPIRAWAQRQVDGASRGELLNRLLRWCAELASGAEPHLTGAEQAAWLARLDAEQDNLRAALRHAEAGGLSELRVRLVSALWRYWYARGAWREGREWLTATVDAGPGPAARPSADWAQACNGAGTLVYVLGEVERAARYYEQSLTERRALGDERGAAGVLNNLGMIAQYGGDPQTAARRFEEALRGYRAAGDVWGTACALNSLGSLWQALGHLRDARPLLEESLALFRQAGDRRSTAGLLVNVATVQSFLGEHDRAEVLLHESAGMFRVLDDPSGLATVLDAQGRLAFARGDWPLAAARAAEVLPLLETHGDPWGLAALRDLEGWLALAHGRLPEAERHFSEALARFRDLDDVLQQAATLTALAHVHLARAAGPSARAVLEEATAHLQATPSWLCAARLCEAWADLAVQVLCGDQALQLLHLAATLRNWSGVPHNAWEGPRVGRAAAMAHRLAEPAGARLPEPSSFEEVLTALRAITPRLTAPAVVLTPREREVARLIAHGNSNGDIARALGVSPRTAETHVLHVMRKLGVQTRAAVAARLPSTAAPDSR